MVGTSHSSIFNGNATLPFISRGDTASHAHSPTPNAFIAAPLLYPTISSRDTKSSNGDWLIPLALGRYDQCLRPSIHHSMTASTAAGDDDAPIIWWPSWSFSVLLVERVTRAASAQRVSDTSFPSGAANREHRPTPRRAARPIYHPTRRRNTVRPTRITQCNNQPCWCWNKGGSRERGLEG
mmetsp:Transcript_36349/g.77514  ORF Transcript_36349/g.77514 Transcript_36349/m.77514 type:complete len:181 (-) Transcript_36349:100-642(-)